MARKGMLAIVSLFVLVNVNAAEPKKPLRNSEPIVIDGKKEVTLRGLRIRNLDGDRHLRPTRPLGLRLPACFDPSPFQRNPGPFPPAAATLTDSSSWPYISLTPLGDLRL